MICTLYDTKLVINQQYHMDMGIKQFHFLVMVKIHAHLFWVILIQLFQCKKCTCTFPTRSPAELLGISLISFNFIAEPKVRVIFGFIVGLT